MEATVSKWFFLNENGFWLKFHRSLFLGFLLTISQDWCRWWLGADLRTNNDSLLTLKVNFPNIIYIHFQRNEAIIVRMPKQTKKIRINTSREMKHLWLYEKKPVMRTLDTAIANFISVQLCHHSFVLCSTIFIFIHYDIWYLVDIGTTLILKRCHYIRWMTCVLFLGLR